MVKKQTKQCSKCGQTGGLLKSIFFATIKGEEYCSSCAQRYIDEIVKNIKVTTTNNIDGYKVVDYIDIDSVEVVIGTGPFSEFGGEIADFFGSRSTAFEQKLKNAKQAAFKKLKLNAHEKGGNAVIGIDIDYTEFSGNRIGVVANGTIVRIEKI